MAEFVVVEAGDATRVLAAAVLARGRRPVPGWRGGAGELCQGVVDAEECAAAAVLAAVRGADLVVALRAPRPLAESFCTDLRHLGRLVHLAGPDLEQEPALAAEEVELLRALLAGHTLGVAARRLHLSRRTADRRLASARRALRASTTAEALRLASAAGMTP